MYYLSAALCGEVTLRDGRVEQSNFHDYRSLRMNETLPITVHVVRNSEAPGGVGEPGHGSDRGRARQCELRGHRKTAAKAATSAWTWVVDPRRGGNPRSQCRWFHFGPTHAGCYAI